jgi:hypothetical protein
MLGNQKNLKAKYRINGTEYICDYGQALELIAQTPTPVVAEVEASWRGQAEIGYVPIDHLDDGHLIIERQL